MQRIAAFITPHGYGHATRCIAILEALQHRFPHLVIDICTTVPESLFTASLQNIHYHAVAGDVGLIQRDALSFDLSATTTALNRLLQDAEALVEEVAARLHGCQLILVDIAPLGILVAERVGIPSVLVENFTWDWLYESFLPACPALASHIRRLQDIYHRATVHIQAEPVCQPSEQALSCPPIFRRRRLASPETLRSQLGSGTKRLVIVSLGGIQFRLPAWRRVAAYPDCFFILAGQQRTRQLSANSLALSHHTAIHHPDLLACADLVVCKSGYSTLAECLQAGTRTLAISRPTFRESATLERFVISRLGGKVISESDFRGGLWLNTLPALLAMPRPTAAEVNGADIAAASIARLCPS